MSCTIKLKKLVEYLQCVDDFESPKILLEQYITPSEIASNFLFTIQNNYNDIRNKHVCDLGAGTGMLSIGCAILESSHVVGFEIDEDALQIAKYNASEMEVSNVDFIQCDILNDLINDDIESKWAKAFDTVIINPPFGTKKNAGIDVKFLQIATKLSRNSIYSLHKTSTRDYIQRKVKEFNCTGKVIAELKYNLDASYKFHKKASKDIEVDVWKLNVIA
jgi:predicted RNA methylase